MNTHVICLCEGAALRSPHPECPKHGIKRTSNAQVDWRTLCIKLRDAVLAEGEASRWGIGSKRARRELATVWKEVEDAERLPVELSPRIILMDDGRAMGGSDVCHTCAAHCTFIGDLQTEIKQVLAEVHDCPKCGYTHACHLAKLIQETETTQQVIDRIVTQAAAMIPMHSEGGEGPTLEINLRPRTQK
jgi:hypothetical protein